MELFLYNQVNKAACSFSGTNEATAYQSDAQDFRQENRKTLRVFSVSTADYSTVENRKTHAGFLRFQQRLHRAEARTGADTSDLTHIYNRQGLNERLSAYGGEARPLTLQRSTLAPCPPCSSVAYAPSRGRGAGCVFRALRQCACLTC